MSGVRDREKASRQAALDKSAKRVRPAWVVWQSSSCHAPREPLALDGSWKLETRSSSSPDSARDEAGGHLISVIRPALLDTPTPIQCPTPSHPEPLKHACFFSQAMSFLQQQESDFRSGGQGGMWKKGKKLRG